MVTLLHNHQHKMNIILILPSTEPRCAEADVVGKPESMGRQDREVWGRVRANLPLGPCSWYRATAQPA